MALKDILPKKTKLSYSKKTNISTDYKNNNNLQKTSYDAFKTYQQTIKGMFGTVIKPEERKIRNYVNVNFWLTKYEEYKRLREKEKDELGIYETLSYGARPSIEYYMLTILSCLIATAGLLQGSPAVIIGAMIVAPLITPILAFSLAVVWGDTQLIKTSIESLIKGTLLAILISSTLAFFVPTAEYNNEILARTKPTLFDILIAVSSGLVGAYGNTNKKISNTLVGIAIAVALMPPLCTIGIGAGNFDWPIARGALLLYTINLISISLAGALVFWITKVHPKSVNTQQVARRALSQIFISIILLTVIAIPVSIYTYRTFTLEQAKKTVWHIAKETFADNLFDIKFYDESNSKIKVIITVLTTAVDKDAFNTLKVRIKAIHPDIEVVKIKMIQTMYEGDSN